MLERRTMRMLPKLNLSSLNKLRKRRENWWLRRRKQLLRKKV